MVAGLVAKTVFFITALFLAMVIADQFVNSANDNMNAMNLQNKFLEEKIRVRVSIESFAYNDAEDQIIIFARNTGSIKLDPSKISVYLNGDRIETTSDYYANMTSDTNLVDSQLWNPQEVLLIAINKSIDAGVAHTLMIAEEHGVYDNIKQQPLATDVSY